MGAAREGHDLFHRFGRRHFVADLRRGHFNGHVWRDTFGRFACWLLGHDCYFTRDWDWVCRRCCHFIRTPLTKEK